LMTALVQPRHTKLGLAGMAQNWAYAAYQLEELREPFGLAGRKILRQASLSIPRPIAATASHRMDALDTRITGKSQPGSTKAYADLTDACNACHKSTDHTMIVIQVPAVGSTAFPDQNFQRAR